jgi:hypothetical protein
MTVVLMEPANLSITSRRTAIEVPCLAKHPQAGHETPHCALQRALKHFRAAAVGLEAVRHNGDEAAVRLQNAECGSQVTCGCGGILKASSVAGEGRVHENHAGPLGQMSPDAGGIIVGHGRVREQVTQDILTDWVDLVKLEIGGVSGPYSQHSSARAGFKHRIVRLNVGQVGRQPSQSQRRGEMLMLDLLLAADGLGWQAGFKVVQKAKCLLGR